MLALELYRDEDGYPDDFIVIIEGNYDYDDYKKTILKSKELYDKYIRKKSIWSRLKEAWNIIADLGFQTF